jgi:hypothetical protein
MWQNTHNIFMRTVKVVTVRDGVILFCIVSIDMPKISLDDILGSQTVSTADPYCTWVHGGGGQPWTGSTGIAQNIEPT